MASLSLDSYPLMQRWYLGGGLLSLVDGRRQRHALELPLFSHGGQNLGLVLLCGSLVVMPGSDRLPILAAVVVLHLHLIMSIAARQGERLERCRYVDGLSLEDTVKGWYFNKFRQDFMSYSPLHFLFVLAAMLLLCALPSRSGELGLLGWSVAVALWSQRRQAQTPIHVSSWNLETELRLFKFFGERGGMLQGSLASVGDEDGLQRLTLEAEELSAALFAPLVVERAPPRPTATGA